MPSFLSPDVYILERDLSTVVPGVATSIAGYVGASQWGPVFTRTQLTDEQTFKTLFGEPTESNGAGPFTDFFTVAGFLKYGNNCIYVRAVNPAVAKNAALIVNSAATSAMSAVTPSAYVMSGASDYISDYTQYTYVPGSEKFKFFGKYPGAWANANIEVALINYYAWNQLQTLPASAWSAQTQGVSAYKTAIEYGPTTVNEYVVLVFVTNNSGDFELAENFFVNDTRGSFDSQGLNDYIEDRINSGSNYILVFNDTAVTNMAVAFNTTLGVFSNGVDGNPAPGDIQNGYDLLRNPEEVEVNFIIGGGHTDVATEQYILALVEQRADCFAILDVPSTDVVGVSNITTAINNVIDFRKNTLNANTSYGALYANWLYIYDKYNDKNRWVPSSGHVAGIYAFTADTTDTWFAPAGLNRGVFRGVIKPAINPSKAYRDTLYQAQVNPIVSFPGQGIVVWGQKTLQTKPSAFDRVNVRLLFLYMEKAIAKSAKFVVFEQNDNLTRALFKNMVIPFMDDIKGRRGVTDYFVDVSDKVNTPERIDRNEFWAEIYVKPTRAAEFIVIRFTATKTGVDFAELAGA